jgi:hypothetical protein
MDKNNQTNEPAAVLEELNRNIPVKYPKGSYVVFLNFDEDMQLSDKYYCCFYCKEPVKGKFGVNVICNPPEWQGLTKEEAEKVGALFDHADITTSRGV